MENNNHSGPKEYGSGIGILRKDAQSLDILVGKPKDSPVVDVKPAGFQDAYFITELRREEYGNPDGYLTNGAETQIDMIGNFIVETNKNAAAGDPRSFVTSVREKKAGYVLLRPTGSGHVEIEDMGVKKEFRQNLKVVETMFDNLLNQRVGGERVTYDA
ncbi:MAG: hypothetical protein H0W89_04025 [Candidatus Levybacteria bacterium]|nr:hypothetical protein [Candidatus Levybacteria bacterium]